MKPESGSRKSINDFSDYGGVACQRQGEIIRDLAIPQHSTHSNASELAKAIVREIRSMD